MLNDQTRNAAAVCSSGNVNEYVAHAQCNTVQSSQAERISGLLSSSWLARDGERGLIRRGPVPRGVGAGSRLTRTEAAPGTGYVSVGDTCVSDDTALGVALLWASRQRSASLRSAKSTRRPACS